MTATTLRTVSIRHATQEDRAALQGFFETVVERNRRNHNHEEPHFKAQLRFALDAPGGVLFAVCVNDACRGCVQAARGCFNVVWIHPDERGHAVFDRAVALLFDDEMFAGDRDVLVGGCNDNMMAWSRRFGRESVRFAVTPHADSARNIFIVDRTRPE